MPIPVTETLDDGVYIDQATPVAGVPSGVPGFEMCLIGHGSRQKTIYSESVVRGQVLDETLTVAATSPHTATLANRATRNSNHTAAYVNGLQLDIAQWNWITPSVTGTADWSSPVNLNNSGAIAYPAIGIKIDGLPSLTIVFETGTPGDINVNSAERQVVVAADASLSAVDQADLVTAINAALHSSIAVNLGYDAATTYASASGNFIKITGASGVASSSADVQILEPMDDSVVSTIFGAAAADYPDGLSSNRLAPSVIQVRDDVYNRYGGSAVYKIDYAKAATTVDTSAARSDSLATSGVTSVTSVGVRSGSADFVKDTDWQEYDTGSAIKVDWSLDSGATLNSLSAAGAGFTTLSDGTLDTIKLGFDGQSPVEYDLVGEYNSDPTTASGVLGYLGSGLTVATLITDINALSAYFFGPEYRSVATSYNDPSVPGNTGITLTSYVQGIAGSISFEEPAAGDATNTIFGFSVNTGDTEVAAQGSGRVPDNGGVYYVNYTAARPSAEYNRRRLFRDAGFALRELGEETSTNPLATCVQMAFDIGVSQLSVIQVNDSSVEGSPTRSEFRTAMQATRKSVAITDIVPLTTSTETIIELLELLAVRNAGQVAQYCRGYVGAPAGTELGDTDQPGTMIYLGKRSFQVSNPESPARGRLIAVAAPTQRALTRTVTASNGSQEVISMTGYHYATAAAARRATFVTPKSTLARKTCNVFDINIDDDELWDDDERVLLIGSGWLTMRFNAGQFTFGSPVTTEFGRQSRIDEFAYDNTSPQKDNLYRVIIASINENLVGVVPTSPFDFALTVRSVIANAINTQIPTSLGQYTDTNGVARPINIQRDITVRQATEEGGSRTRWLFDYSAFLAYPALSFLGTAYWDKELPTFGSVASSDLL